MCSHEEISSNFSETEMPLYPSYKKPCAARLSKMPCAFPSQETPLGAWGAAAGRAGSVGQGRVCGAGPGLWGRGCCSHCPLWI